jgi:hypothetical protein
MDKFFDDNSDFIKQFGDEQRYCDSETMGFNTLQKTVKLRKGK